MDSNTRTRAVIAAAGRDLNDELTILFTGVDEALRMCEPGDPRRALLLDMRAAAQRCAWKAAGMLTFAARLGGARIGCVSMEHLIERDYL